MKYSGKVMIEKVTDKTGVRPATKNPHARDNVNVAQGPRTGNRGSSAKRTSFMDDKDERGTLADSINRAIAGRAPRDHVQSNLEGIDSDVRPKKLKRATY